MTTVFSMADEIESDPDLKIFEPAKPGPSNVVCINACECVVTSYVIASPA